MNNFKSTAKFVWSWFRIEKKYFFLTIFFTLILFSLQVAMPIFFKKIIDIASDENITKNVRTQNILQVFYFIIAVAL